jgi:CheY-like chemotaxis protein
MQDQAPPVVPNASLRGKILAVDDEEAVLEMEKELLGGAGAEVICARDGAEAILRLESDLFDAVVIDSKMPGEVYAAVVYRWVQQKRPEMSARFIFTICHGTEGRVREFLEEHAVTHIEKPFQVSELIALLRRIIAAHKATAMRGAS